MAPAEGPTSPDKTAPDEKFPREKASRDKASHDKVSHDKVSREKVWHDVVLETFKRNDIRLVRASVAKKDFHLSRHLS